VNKNKVYLIKPEVYDETNAMAKEISSKRRLIRMIGMAVLILIIAVLGAYLLLQGRNIAVLNPQGIIASKEQGLIVFTVLLGLIVVVPVFIMLFGFAWKYREGNEKAKYTPNDDHNKWIEAVWWGIPIAIIGVLSVLTWVTSHELDPYKKLDSNLKPIKIQVVALEWKWLFLYPDQGIATVNEVRFPEKTPVNFELTADAPMSAFWIPNLGSQIYAMSGMSSQLSLEANTTGEYRGANSNINGNGYSGMTFKAISLKQHDFDMWAHEQATSNNRLDWNRYDGELAKPSKNNRVTYYMLQDRDLYDMVINKYMAHGEESTYGDTNANDDSHMNMNMDMDMTSHEGMNH